MKSKGFVIGDMKVVLSHEIDWEESMTQYSVDKAENVNHTVDYEINLVDQFEPLNCTIIRKEQYPPQLIGMYNDREIRIYGEIFGPDFCAVYMEEKSGIRLTIQKDYFLRMAGRQELLNCFAIEKQLMQAGWMMFHCSYIIVNGKAILFSGNSGIGKSTQAELWRKYRGADVINGDRCILKKKDGKWIASGIPFCGSSNINKNVSAEIEAIVFLAQNPENIIGECSPAEAVRKLYMQMTVNTWNDTFVQRVLSVCENLARDMHILTYACDKTEEAVEVLAEYLLD